MTQPYKLTEEIRRFIVEQKKTNPGISCRKLIPLIRKNFQVSLSKSLINNVIQDNNLSSPSGRSRISKSEIVAQPVEIQKITKQEHIIQPLKRDIGFIRSGGCLFLKAAEIKLCLTQRLAENLSSYFPGLTAQSLQALIEAFIFMPIFNSKYNLWLFMGKEISEDNLGKYLPQLTKVALPEFNQAVRNSGINHNLINIKELQQIVLIQLNSYVQANFFPPAYQFLALAAMQERFYSLWAKIRRDERFLDAKLFYPEDFAWRHDIVWQEDLSFAINRVNESKVLTQEERSLRISLQVGTLPTNAL